MDEKAHNKECAKEPVKKPDEERLVQLKESEYLKLKEEVGKARTCEDRLLRMHADLENTRKRLEREKQDFVKFANEGIIAELLNVLDDLERTVELAQKQPQNFTVFLKGVEMILSHLYEMLKGYGVKPIEAAGKIFDPHLHEALMQVEDKNLPEHTVIEELQKGYTINDRVLRTTKVKVSKKVVAEEKKEEK